MKVAAKLPDEAIAQAPAAAPAKKDFARHLKVSKKAADDQATPDAGQPQAPQPQTLGQIVVALASAGTSREHPDAPQAAAVAAIANPPIAPPDVTTPQIAAAIAAIAKPEAAKPELPLTPLEQAVHDLLSELGNDHDRPTAAPMLTQMPVAPLTTALEALDAPVAAQPAAPVAPAQQPAELASQHHAHIVLDEPGLRVVMTVAVRGSEVSVNMRSSDDQTAAALARNAGSLDEAMRAHKLDLNSFSAERDHTRERDKPHHERNSAKPAQPFVLEETP